VDRNHRKKYSTNLFYNYKCFSLSSLYWQTSSEFFLVFCYHL